MALMFAPYSLHLPSRLGLVFILSVTFVTGHLQYFEQALVSGKHRYTGISTIPGISMKDESSSDVGSPASTSPIQLML